MGCSCSDMFKKPEEHYRRSSVHSLTSLHFCQTEIFEIDNFFNSIKQQSSEIIPNIAALQVAKSRFYHKLHLLSLFVNPNSNVAVISMILYLVATGNKIEFLDSCPYLEVETPTEIFPLYINYVESLHENIIALTKIKPELQEYIIKSNQYLQMIPYIADKEGLDLNQKLNSTAILINNCKALWNLPKVVEDRLWNVKKDLMDLRDGIRYSITLSVKFSIIHGTSEGASFDETIRKIWHDPSELLE